MYNNKIFNGFKYVNDLIILFLSNFAYIHDIFFHVGNDDSKQVT